MRPPTLKDVAAAAGVSASTVSRVVNDAAGVSDAVRQRVVLAVGELGYVSNRTVRAAHQTPLDPQQRADADEPRRDGTGASTPRLRLVTCNPHPKPARKPVTNTVELLGPDAENLLTHEAAGVVGDLLHLPGHMYVDHFALNTDRSPRVLRALQSMFGHGALADTGYLSILPVDQGVEHSAAAAFAPNPVYFDPQAIVELAVHAGCSAVTSTLGALKATARRYAHRIPYIVKINHNELLSYPNTHDQVMFASVEQAADLGAVGVGATVYFGSCDSRRQIGEVSAAFARAHELGLFTVLWCYVRNPDFTVDGTNHESAADLTGQANHLGATIGADIIKQKLPVTNGGFTAVDFGKTDPSVYDAYTTDHPIDLARWQVLNCYAGRIGLISSGGAAGGEDDLGDAVRTAVINKRAGGIGLILGRKAFQRPFDHGVELLRAVQNVYLDPLITIA